MAHSVEEALKIAAAITYPVMVRPSYVLGGRSMQIVYDEAGLLALYEFPRSKPRPSIRY